MPSDLQILRFTTKVCNEQILVLRISHPSPASLLLVSILPFATAAVPPSPPVLMSRKMQTFRRIRLLLAIFVMGLLCRSSAGAAVATSASIYEVLRSHGLPIGLLPKGVKEFKVDEKGRFEVQLDHSCNARFESEVHYDRNVSGVISDGQIGAISGLTAQDLFLWFPVVGIRVDIPSSGIIYFDVGVVRKQFPLSLFETPPDCLAVGPPEVFLELQHKNYDEDGDRLIKAE